MTLWDIVNQFKASDFCLRASNFATFEARFMHADPAKLEEWVQLCIDFCGQIKHAANDCYDVGLNNAWNEIDRVNSNAGLHPNSPTVQAAAASQIRECLIAELRRHKFLYVDPRNAEYVDQDAMFGTEVGASFPHAAFDIRESGNCLASECATAAVFHLMRAAEHGLRVLARDRRIKLPKKAAIDLATWEEIIRELEKAEQVIQTYPKTLAREAQYEFYHGAMMEFKRFKNVFRNRIMHTRDEYDRDQAHSASCMSATS